MISVYEERRRAPLHFSSRAANALHSASVLSEAGVTEGFVREGSLALELIIKAVIAQRLENGENLAVTRVPISHNVPQLWQHARLPEASGEDYRRLVRARVYLMWAGRYPAPNRDEDGDRDHADIWQHSYDGIPISNMFRKPHTFNLEDVSRIYAIAEGCFWTLRDHAST